MLALALQGTQKFPCHIPSGTKSAKAPSLKCLWAMGHRVPGVALFLPTLVLADPATGWLCKAQTLWWPGVQGKLGAGRQGSKEILRGGVEARMTGYSRGQSPALALATRAHAGWGQPDPGDPVVLRPPLAPSGPVCDQGWEAEATTSHFPQSNHTARGISSGFGLGTGTTIPCRLPQVLAQPPSHCCSQTPQPCAMSGWEGGVGWSEL